MLVGPRGAGGPGGRGWPLGPVEKKEGNELDCFQAGEEVTNPDAREAPDVPEGQGQERSQSRRPGPLGPLGAVTQLMPPWSISSDLGAMRLFGLLLLLLLPGGDLRDLSRSPPPLGVGQGGDTRWGAGGRSSLWSLRGWKGSWGGLGGSSGGFEGPFGVEGPLRTSHGGDNRVHGQPGPRAPTSPPSREPKPPRGPSKLGCPWRWELRVSWEHLRAQTAAAGDGWVLHRGARRPPGTPNHLDPWTSRSLR